MEKISSVDSINIYPMADGRWGVDATGQVPTAGWTRAALVSHSGIINPNGDLEFDFLAERPDRALQVLSEISAHATVGGPGTDTNGLKRIVVHGARRAAVADFPG